MLICVVLTIYAGWLVLISAGDEEKLKKAKNIVIYIALGLIVLVAGHALLKFFVLRG
jgi:Type IV secretion system pilin